MSPRISVPMPRSAASRFWGLGGLGAAATIFNEARATAGYDYYRRDARPRETAPGKLRVETRNYFAWSCASVRILPAFQLATQFSAEKEGISSAAG
jgi:hypothetical protein